jgi:capsular polysaccharide biosynthesis protein
MTKENIKSMPLSEQEGEVDFINLAQKFWEGRKIVLKIMLISIVIGFFVAFLSPKEYIASSTMVPQVTDPKSKLGALSGLAAMAGVSLNNVGSSELLPTTFPQIISSVPFQLELMNTLLKFKNLERPVTLFDYYTKYRNTNPLIKYTIGLPNVIIKAIKGESKILQDESPDSPYQLTDDQIEVQKIMAETIGVNINDKDGYVTLFCSLPEAYAAAQLTKSAQLLLQRYITEFKIKKAQANHDFIQQRYDEVKKKYHQSQAELALFRDKNKNVSTAIARTDQEQLTAEYTLIYGVYSELAKKLEQAKIEVKEETPVFTVIKPVSVPTEKSKPNRPYIIAIFAFIGLIAGTVAVLSRDYIDQIRGKWNSKIEEQVSV